MRRLCCTLVAVAAVAMLLGGAVRAQTEEFTAANKFYEEKDYPSAIRLYLSVLNQHGESATLYHNLGNTYFKAGDLGHAVLYYTRAKRLAPSDEDIAHNLEFSQQFSRIQMEGVQLNPISAFFSSIVDPYRLDGMAWLTCCLFVIFTLLLTVRYGLGVFSPVVRIAATVTLLFVLLLGGLTSFKYRTDYLTRRAVIVADECPVRTGASEQSDMELQGAPGLVVQIMSETNDYYNVLFENKRRGWVKKELVAEI